jgi:hypothetical protein
MRQTILGGIGLLCALAGCGSFQDRTRVGSNEALDLGAAKLIVINEMVAEAPSWAKKICIEQRNVENRPILRVLLEESERQKIKPLGRDLTFGNPSCRPPVGNIDSIVITYYSGVTEFIKAHADEEDKREIDQTTPGIRAAVESGNTFVAASYSYCGKRIFSLDRTASGNIKIEEWPNSRNCRESKGAPVFVVAPKCESYDRYLPGSTPIDDKKRDIILPKHINDACYAVRIEDGLSFYNDLITYDCSTSYSDLDEREKSLASNLGFSGPLLFGPPNETLSNGYQDNSSTSGIVLILATKYGEIKQVLTNRVELGTIQKVSSARAAIDLLTLNGQFDDWNLSHICDAWVVDEPDGWLFKNVKENCKPYERNISVTTAGKISVGDLTSSSQEACTVY